MCIGQSCPNIRKNETAMAHIPSAPANTYEARYDVSAIPSIPFCMSGCQDEPQEDKRMLRQLSITNFSIAMWSS